MSKSRFFYGWYIVAASWVMSFLVGSVSVAVFFKPMLEDFGWDRAVLSSVQSVALIFFTLALPFLGRLIDQFGPRTMIFVSVASQVLSNVINSIATHIWHLCLARFLYGILAHQSTQILINRWFIKRRGTAQGIVASSMPLGTMLLAPISQYLILIWGWRQTMLFWAIVMFFVMLPSALIMRNKPEDMGIGPDGEPLPDAITLNPLQLKRIEASANPNPQIKGRFSALVRNKSFLLLSISHCICGLGCGFMMTHIVVFATDLGHSAMIATSFLSVQAASCLIGVLVMGWLSDRIMRKNVLALTHFIRSLSFFIILASVFFIDDSLWMLYLAMVFFGFGWFTTAPLAAALVADLFGNSRMGAILGVVLSCHMFGMALGAYAGGAIFELTGSYYFFFLIQGPLELIAALLAFLIRYQGVSPKALKKVPTKSGK